LRWPAIIGYAFIPTTILNFGDIETTSARAKHNFVLVLNPYHSAFFGQILFQIYFRTFQTPTAIGRFNLNQINIDTVFNNSIIIILLLLFKLILQR
jgi:hypothetical protein